MRRGWTQTRLRCFDVAERQLGDVGEGFRAVAQERRDESLNANVQTFPKVALGVPDGRVFQVAVLAKFRILVDAQGME